MDCPLRPPIPPSTSSTRTIGARRPRGDVDLFVSQSGGSPCLFGMKLLEGALEVVGCPFQPRDGHNGPGTGEQHDDPTTDDGDRP
jgi:hypothetical protein